MSDLAVRFGEADLTTCDREPIHIPGSIQPHGVLLVVDREDLKVEQAAGDTKTMLGVDPANIFGQEIAALFEPEIGAFLKVQLGSSAGLVAPIMRLGVVPKSAPATLDITIHGEGRTAIVELEPARPSTAAGDPIVQLKYLIAAVQHTGSLEECCAAAATAMRSVTGFDRAMVYRFLPDDSGVVVAEDATAGLESFLGLHYPASDIPKQARELYRRNWLRAIPNIDYIAAPLLPPVSRRSGQPIDMSHCGLRSVSPIHLEYLRNMGVCASLSASIVFQDRLWGMLVLHHYSPRHVPADLRVACETFAQILSLQVESKVQSTAAVLKDNARRVLQDLVGRMTEAADIGSVLASRDLLRYLNATGAVVYLEGQLHRIGATPAPAEIMALVEWLNRVNRPLFESSQLSLQYPPATAYATLASGLLAVGLSRAPRDYVLWFRPEFGRTVRWAGDPTKPTKVDRHGIRLTPRGSFAEWLEVTRMQSEPWSESDLEAAQGLRVLFLESVLKSLDMKRQAKEFEETRAMAEELERRVAQRTEQLRTVAAELEIVEDRQRRQIARDLHDDLGQTLAAARIRLASLCSDERADVQQASAAVGELIDRANNAIRSLAAQLAPEVLVHELGISPALEWLSEEIERTFGLKVKIVDDGKPKRLSEESRSIIYRAVRELLINVARHAQVNSANVEARCEGEVLVIGVTDNGAGYDMATQFAAGRRGLGLLSVRERLSLIGGTVSFRSAPAAGTTCILTAPLLPRAAPPAGREL